MEKPRLIKCVVWDLDNTLWEGVLLESPAVHLRPEVAEVLRTLDERGIVHSIASRNDHVTAMARLTEWGLDEWFLHPQINWGSKVASIRAIAAALGIGLDAIAFVDDDPFERDGVAAALPGVLCLDAAYLGQFTGAAELTPPTISDEARHRRLLYRSDIARSQAEVAFTGPSEELPAMT